ncbi:MAG: S41 family peptidase, partial [Ekhidna sp.]|nr:S41 family peptidase [Ekhidna sp.]
MFSIRLDIGISMRLAKEIVRTFIFIFIILACKGEDDLSVEECNVTVMYDGATLSVCEDDEVDSLVRDQDLFIWQAMNLFYYYQPDVPALADDLFPNYKELYNYLNRFSSSESMFSEGLLSNSDRFSWIVDDYVALEESFQGIGTSFGYEFRLLRESEGSSNLFGYVEYVIDDGPAYAAGLKRGDIFNKVNGIQLTTNNYQNALFGTDAYRITLAKIENNEILSTNSSVSLAAVPLTENPILYHDIIELEGLRAGYLVYNQFIHNNNAHRELNNVFGSFKSAGVSELILDLRYNPGGSVLTTRILASLIYAATSSTEFGSIIFNDKLKDFFNNPLYFLEELPIVDEDTNTTSIEEINSLNNLSRVFVLTSNSTASASELLIVGLSPYLD